MQAPENVLDATAGLVVFGLGATQPHETHGASLKAKRYFGGLCLAVCEALGFLKSRDVPLDRNFICFDSMGELLEKHFVHKIRAHG